MQIILIKSITMNTKSKQTELINKKVMPFNLSTKPDKTINLSKSDKTIIVSTKSDKITNRLNSTINVSKNRINNNSTIIKNPLNIKHNMKDVSQMITTNDKTCNSITKFNKTNLIKSNKLNTTTIKPTTSTNYDYPCQLCELNFDTIERLDFHLIKIHKIDKRINLVQCYKCEDKFNKRMQLVDHLINIHNLEIKVYQDTIKSLDEFFKWKDKLENESGFKWIQNNKFYLNNRLRKTYICNRTATNGIKLYSLHGLTTINNHSTLCLSSIKITENENGEFVIEFIETHNHDDE